jgi:hypothetical protein
MANENENRVLGRRGARLVSNEEANGVGGGFQIKTLTPCTADARAMAAGASGADGDAHIPADHC